VCEAIGNRDPQAAREAMAAHVTWARQDVPVHVATIAESAR
jgi:DNA-binding GntR family transcriptional regulator